MLPDLLLAMVILVIYVFLLLIRSCYKLQHRYTIYVLFKLFTSHLYFLVFHPKGKADVFVLSAVVQCTVQYMLCLLLYPSVSCCKLRRYSWHSIFYSLPFYISLFSNAANSFLPVIFPPAFNCKELKVKLKICSCGHTTSFEKCLAVRFYLYY
jgi:hypothetical protein